MLPASRACTLGAEATRLCVTSLAAAQPRCTPRSTCKRFHSDSRTYEQQSHPFQGYYADLLDAPLPKVQPGTRTAPEPPPAESLPKTEKEERLAKARVVFGSRLAGPAERRAEIEGRSYYVAGVMVPPKPEEPDNCCMSGCVNCVWDRYRDELEEWAAKSAEARMKLQEQRDRGRATGMMSKGDSTPNHMALSMDDDGGGSETNWAGSVGTQSLDQQGADLFADIPVGIREFMKTEKRLKEKKKKERAIAG